MRNRGIHIPRFTVAVLVTAALFTSCGPRTPEYRPSIVLITIDTIRTDHMSLYGYERETTPEIDAFFADGAVFDRAYATTSYTPASVVSFLTGLYPQHHGVRYFLQPVEDDVESLARWLGDDGYETAAFVSNINLRGAWIGLDAHFDHYDDLMLEREKHRVVFERSAEPNTDAALEWLQGRDDPERPFFLWVHYIDPHGPYTPPEPLVREFSHDAPLPIDPERVPEYQRDPEVRDGREYVDRYDEEIAHMDAQIGRLLRGLEAYTDPAETLYALTADHGEILMEVDPWFSHGKNVHEPAVRAPLAFRGPGIAPRRDATPVSIVDVPPTILGALGRRMPKGLDGVPLAKETPARPIFVDSEVEYNTGWWKGVVEGDTKWVVFAPKYEAPLEYRRYTLTDSDESSYETWDPETATGAAKQLLDWWDADPEDFVSAGDFATQTRLKHENEPSVEEQLKALGYL